MGKLMLNFKVSTLCFVIALSFTSCTKIITILDIFGIIPPREQKLELQLEKQVFDKPFTFADYCKEGYDSIFLVYPYFNTEREDFASLTMSKQLKNICESNINLDTFYTLLFIKGDKVKAYSEVERINADFITRESERHYIFPFNQEFIMDEDRGVRTVHWHPNEQQPVLH